MTTDTIKAIQKQIVAKIEAGEDVSELTRQLARVRAEIAAQVEVQELRKIAEQRQALRDRAEAVKVKAKKQGEAIDRFLTSRDNILPQLLALIEPVKELAKMGMASWERDPGECYLYNDSGPFQGDMRGIPIQLLPQDFKCPTLEMTAPGERSFGKASEALRYFEACIGILANFRKGYMTAYSQPTDDSLLLDNEPETSEVELNCRVCNHEKVAEINKALQNSRSLRDIETEFNVSRSTLSRHKNNCLNLGAVRLHE
ncbi:MAG TPA: hypothetical protein VMX96_04610 [Dehalococcoidia bacterium]|nr:hypothetical protein [Dehalococcoidia bacterium]